MTEDVDLRPSQPVVPKAPLVVGAVLLLSLILLCYLAKNPAGAPLVDFIIRHQILSFTMLGVITALLIAWYATKVGRVRVAQAETRDRTGRAFAPSVFVAPILLPFTIAAGSSVVGSAAVGALSPIPKTAGLELPQLIRDLPQNQSLLLFIHGWNGDAAGTWQLFPRLVEADHRLDSYNIWSVDYPTFMLRRNLSIAQLADFFARHFDETSGIFDRYDRIVVVAHSMGGLVSREITIQQALRGRPSPFRKIIEIATPHEGADPAGLAKALRLTRPLTDDMQKGSEFLRDLRTHWFALRSKPPTFCIGSPQDRVVSVQSATAQCADATNYFQGSHTAIVKPDSHADLRYATPMAQVLIN